MPPNEHENVSTIHFRQDLTLTPDEPPQPLPGGIPWLAALKFRVLRASDLAHFDVAAYGVSLVRSTDGPPHLVPATDKARLEVHLAFQHVGEQAFYEVLPNPNDPTPETPDPPTAIEDPQGHTSKALAAWPSRLVFRVPEGESIEFSTGGVLAAMGRLPLIVVPLATPLQQVAASPLPNQPPALGRLTTPVSPSRVHRLSTRVRNFGQGLTSLQPRAPRPDETAIEAPFRLVISPSTRGGFSHEVEPVAHPDNPNHIELWHTRLGVRNVTDGGRVHVDEAPAPEKSVRAVWARDLDIYPGPGDPPQANEPFRMSLTPADRAILVRQTSDPRQVTPQPVEARRLYLSALGAWLDLRGLWDTDPYANLTPKLAAIMSWDHRAAMGRDYHVKVVYPGYLFPFGHRAALVKVTKRKIKHEPGQAPQAYLYQRKFLVITEPERTFGLDAKGRAFPFQRLRIGPLITPDLVDPLTVKACLAPGDQLLFWPSLPTAAANPSEAELQRSRFLFDLDALDRDGNPVHLQAPLLFVADSYEPESDVAGYYALNGRGGKPANPDAGGVVPAAGQGIAVVPSGKPGDAVLEAVWLRFTGEPQTTSSRPRLVDASVVVPAAKQLAPHAPNARMLYARPWLEGAAHAATAQQPFGTANTGEVFAELRADVAFDLTSGQAPQTFLSLSDVGVGVSYAGGTGRAGGFIQPDLPGRGLSRSRGLVGDLDNIAASTFNAAAFLGDALPRLFGLFNLVDLITPGNLGLDDAPAFVVEHGDDPTLDAVRASLHWQPPMRSWPADGSPVLELPPDALALRIEVTSAGANVTASTYVSAELVDFTLHLMPDAPLMSVHIDRLVFLSQSGRKPDVDVVFGGMTFDGVLGFIDTLRQMIPLDGFSDPPYVDVSDQDVTAGFDLAVPNIAVGMFSLENLAVGADCRIPFLGEAVTVGFHFCTRDKPFRITVMMIGGGGFVGLRLSPKGMVLLEMALEAGASLSVDFGVASGSVSAMVGIYLRLEDDAGSLTGYFRIRGEVEVLAIASASLTLELSLTYDFDTGKMIGRASLVIEVEVLCFSASVEVVCERRLAGSKGDPTFAEILGGVAPDGTNPHWTEYCQAFAGA